MDLETLSPKRVVKNCTFSETTVAYVEQYAQQHGMAFSRTIEALALRSLRDARMLGTLALIQETIRVEVGKQYNRIAKLMAYTAVQAGTAKEAAQALYWGLILQELDTYVDSLGPGEVPTMKGLAAQFGLAADDIGSEAAAALFKSRVANFRYRAVKGLRQPAAEVADLLFELQQAIAESDEATIKATVSHLQGD